MEEEYQKFMVKIGMQGATIYRRDKVLPIDVYVTVLIVDQLKFDAGFTQEKFAQFFN